MLGDATRDLQAARGTSARTLSELQHALKLTEDAQQTGLQRILSISRDFERYGGNWMQRLTGARQCVDLLGFSLLVWSKGTNFKQEVIDLVQRGVHVRVLTMDLANPDFHSFVNKQIVAQKDEDLIKGEVRAGRNVFDDITTALASSATTPRGSFTFRMVKHGLIVCQICRTDDELIAIPYLYSVVASESPLLLIKGENTGVFKCYQKEFDELWKRNA